MRCRPFWMMLLQWRHKELDGVSNHQPHYCLLNRLFRRRSKKTPKLRVTGLCAGNSSVTGGFPAQRDRNAENVSIWWRHHVTWPTIIGSYDSQGIWEETCTTLKSTLQLLILFFVYKRGWDFNDLFDFVYLASTDQVHYIIKQKSRQPYHTTSYTIFCSSLGVSKRN